MASATAPVQRLTDYNHAVAALSLGRVETVEWQGPDGVRENGVVIYSPDFTAGRRYPMVLEVHGGPRAASLETFARTTGWRRSSASIPSRATARPIRCASAM
jgi:dipeptidyl aminopeptidase/acylaminoacyl peptidase